MMLATGKTTSESDFVVNTARGCYALLEGSDLPRLFRTEIKYFQQNYSRNRLKSQQKISGSTKVHNTL